jgi:hypothetical protein
MSTPSYGKHSSDHDLFDGEAKLSLSSTEIDYPYCYSFTIPSIGVTYFSCAATAYSKFVTFETTFSGENDGRTWSQVYASGSSTGISLPDNTASTSATTPNSSPTQSSKPKSTPIGAIVGGVVGGLAIIGIAIAALLFLLLRRRKPNNGATAAGPAPSQGPAPNMTEQQAPQSMYGVPAGYQSQQDPSAAGYYAGAKQDYQGGYDAAVKFGGVQVNQQEVKPSTSPVPPHSLPVPQQNPGITPVGGPPNVQDMNMTQPHGSPGMNNYQFQQQQPMGGPPQMQHNVAQELPAQFATTMHNAQGDPIFEAPDQAYRSA